MDDLARRVWRRRPGGQVTRMRFATYGERAQELVAQSPDPIRYGTVALAVQAVLEQDLSGSLAEVGVYRGELSRLIT